MQRVFICERKSTCPLFDYTWDWLVDARPNDISSLVFLFFQFARSVDETDPKQDSGAVAAAAERKSKTRPIAENTLATGGRETLRVVFEPPPMHTRKLNKRIMRSRYANNINALASRSSRFKGRRVQRQQSVAMVTAANDQIRVAVFCEAPFNVELSRQITEQVLRRFATNYAEILKQLEPAFAEEAKDQNEARTHLKYMEHFRDFVGPLNHLVEKHPKSTLFSNGTSVSMRSRGGSKVDPEEKYHEQNPSTAGNTVPGSHRGHHPVNQSLSLHHKDTPS